MAVERYNGDTKELEQTDMMSFADSDGGRHKEVSGGKETLSGIRRLCPTPSICCALLLAFQGRPAEGAIPAGHVSSHGLERDMVNADGTGQGAGYFTFIEGIPGPLFGRSRKRDNSVFHVHDRQVFYDTYSQRECYCVDSSSGQLLCLSKPDAKWKLE